MTHSNAQVLCRVAICCLLSFVIGCQPLRSQDTAIVVTTPAPTGTLTPSPTAVSLAPSPTPTATSTVGPLPTTSPNLTASPVATLPLAQAQALIEDYLYNNAGCRLPCWWGFIPGRTPWQEAYPLLARFDANIFLSSNSFSVDPSYAEVTIPVSEDIYPTHTRQRYTMRGGLIEVIEVVPGYVPTYSLPNLLRSYGQPTEVWLRTYSQALFDDLPFDIVLFYREHGILARFAGQGIVINDTVRSCPAEPEAPVLALWSPEQALTFADATNQTINIRNEVSWPYRQLEEVTDTTTEEFSQSFVGPGPILCLQTPTALWPDP